MNDKFKRECAEAVGDAINAWGWALITTLTKARIAIADLDIHGFIITSVEVNNTDAVIYIRHTDQCEVGPWSSEVTQWQGRNGMYYQTHVHGVKVRWSEHRWPWPATPVIPAGMPEPIVHGRQTINPDNA